MKERLKENIKNLNQPSYKGKYIEMGAVNGHFQSNTHWIQEEYNWTGILVEPSPIQFEKLKTLRPNNFYFNCACVSFDYQNSTIDGDFDGDPMSSVEGLRRGRTATHTVQARTLQSILDETNIGDIDFFSLDVEGYEIEVLKGINFEKQKIHQILIEITEKKHSQRNSGLEIISSFMFSKNYSLAPVDYGAGLGCISAFTPDPNPRNKTAQVYNGHNDYLFNLNI